MTSSRIALSAAFALLTCVPSASAGQAQARKTGAELYSSACAACHGPDGKGQLQTVVGFSTPLPDFTDCGFATPEADLDWIAVVHQGGRARAFDRMMPAFGDALSEAEISSIVDHLRTFCVDPGWPRGDLNLPRPLVTEKAFPENEAVLTTTISRGPSKAIVNELLYERRIGRRGQWEVAIPIAVRETDGEEWRRGVGDLALAFKQVVMSSVRHGSIFSAGGEVILPTGKEADGLGSGVTTLEPFATFGQILPDDGFLHLHAGLEIPVATARRPNQAFGRLALGKTWAEGRWGRAWSPMLEMLGTRELTRGEPVLWDVVPQVQVSLSTRQHVLLNAGVRVPLNRRDERRASFITYLLWDWFDGGLFTGW